uniref:Uncharacterized protein n=1 Tax=Rhizophora mucronata TaxID=61149 RepID=A0A2P2PA01_RHIMU
MLENICYCYSLLFFFLFIRRII